MLPTGPGFTVTTYPGCDYTPEQVAEQLFRPLVAQVIHWLTGNTKYESQDTIALLEAILVSLHWPIPRYQCMGMSLLVLWMF